jgi:FtsH-binding integral membrane protein
MYASGLEPRPENALWAWMVSPRVSGVATQGLLLLLGGTTVWLAAALVADVRRIWRAYAAWAAVGGVLTAYALAANWQLAREAGTLALVVGGLWSVAVAFAIARTEPTAVGT